MNSSNIMTRIQIVLPDQLAEEAQNAGLLKPDAIETMLRESLRRRAVDELFEAMDRMAAANFPPMTLDEIQQEVNAVRAQRRRRAPGT
jgi:Arc/MetJ family transcription regulator